MRSLSGMREILHAIHAAKDDYARLPFFRFLRDESMPPRDRLAFVPCMAPFIMDFGDLNRYVLRDASSDDPYQQLVNEHTFEDDHHWPWYLEDVAALGHDRSRPTTDVLRELYSDRMAVNRLLASKLAHLVADATPIERLVVIEAIEETGNVLFTHTAALARRVEHDEGIELRYLGDFHLTLESGHARTSDDGHQPGGRGARRRGAGPLPWLADAGVRAVRRVGRRAARLRHRARRLAGGVIADAQ